MKRLKKERTKNWWFWKDNIATWFFDLVFTEVGALTAPAVGTINRVSIISTQPVDGMTTVLDLETNLASTRLWANNAKHSNQVTSTEGTPPRVQVVCNVDLFHLSLYNYFTNLNTRRTEILYEFLLLNRTDYTNLSNCVFNYYLFEILDFWIRIQ